MRSAPAKVAEVGKGQRRVAGAQERRHCASVCEHWHIITQSILDKDTNNYSRIRDNER